MGPYILDSAGTLRCALDLSSSTHSIVLSKASSHVINIDKEIDSLIRYCANQDQIDDSITNIQSTDYDAEQAKNSIMFHWAQDVSLSLHNKSPLVVYDDNASSLTDGGNALNYLLFGLGHAANSVDDKAMEQKIPVIILSKRPGVSFSREITADTLLSYSAKQHEREAMDRPSDSNDPGDDTTLSEMSTSVFSSLGGIPKSTIERILTYFKSGDDDVTECFCNDKTSSVCPSATGQNHCPVFSRVYRAAEEMIAQVPQYNDNESENVNQNKFHQTVSEKVFRFHHPKIKVCGFGILSEEYASLFTNSYNLEQNENELGSRKNHTLILLDYLLSQAQTHVRK